MKGIADGLITALSMYSIIPTKKLDWNKDTMKYAMAFFPVVGIVIGALMYFLNRLLFSLNVSEMFYAVAMSLVPLIISGGIHFDGFIDTNDALYSRKDIESKLLILKDPHVGAFGVISSIVIFIITLGLFSQLYKTPKYIALLYFCYFASRCLSGISVVKFKTAKNTGLLYIFADNSHRATAFKLLLAQLILVFALILWVNFYMGLALVASMGLWFLGYKKISYSQFGGITGDLAGYFLVISEAISLFVVAVGGMIC